MINERIARLRLAATRMHRDQADQQGQPYIQHLLAVASGVSDISKPVALFHDALEDGRATEQQLGALLNATELTAVRIVTRQSDEPYATYIARVATAPGPAGEIAREVKLADIRHNLERLTPRLERLRRRYQQALVTLTIADAVLADAHPSAPAARPAFRERPGHVARVYHGPRPAPPT